MNQAINLIATRMQVSTGSPKQKSSNHQTQKSVNWDRIECIICIFFCFQKKCIEFRPEAKCGRIARNLSKFLIIVLKKDEMSALFIKKYFVKPKKCIDFYSEGRKTKTKKNAVTTFRQRGEMEMYASWVRAVRRL